MHTTHLSEIPAYKLSQGSKKKSIKRTNYNIETSTETALLKSTSEGE